MRPRRLAGAISATYIGETIDAPPTASPPRNRARINQEKLGDSPVATVVSAKSPATASKTRRRPTRSVSRPAITEPRMQPNSRELNAQPRLRSSSLKCCSRNGPAPVIMAISNPNSSPPSAAVKHRKKTNRKFTRLCIRESPVHGEFVIEVRRGGDPAPLLLYMANCHLSSDWQFKQSVAVALPAVILKAGGLRGWAARFLPGRVAG